MNQSNQAIIKSIDKILEIGILLSVEKNCDKILEIILEQARFITNADAGTIYLCEGENLVFKIMQNNSIDIGNSFHSNDKLPAVPISEENAAGYTVLSKKIINIDDVYKNNQFDFNGSKKYDKITSYKTISMLVAPLKNSDDEVIGVLQIINAKNEEGQIIPFSERYEKLISSLASQAAISISNIWNIEQIKKLLDSFVKSMATAIDARTPYNASHTKRVVKLVEKIISIINSINSGRFKNEYFDENRTEQLLMAAWLHDIGKLGTPLSIINKSSKLEESLPLLIQRLDYIRSNEKVRYWKGKATAKWGKDDNRNYSNRIQLLELAEELIIKTNNSGYALTEKDESQLIKIAKLRYIDERGREKNWLTEDELQALLIKKGSLTDSERKMVENHVEIGLRILKGIPLAEKLRQVPNFVYMHHELLDGSGYPRGLHKNDIPLEVRILTLIDIFDALTSSDRPYRKANSIESTLNIIGNMVKNGKIDRDLFKILHKYKIWECL